MKKIITLFTIIIALAINVNAQWTLLTSGKTNDFTSVYFTDANTGYVVGDDNGQGSGGMILKTTNGGSTWNTQTSGVTNDIFSVYFLNANIGYAVGYNKV